MRKMEKDFTFNRQFIKFFKELIVNKSCMTQEKIAENMGKSQAMVSLNFSTANPKDKICEEFLEALRKYTQDSTIPEEQRVELEKKYQTLLEIWNKKDLSSLFKEDKDPIQTVIESSLRKIIKKEIKKHFKTSFLNTTRNLLNEIIKYAHTIIGLMNKWRSEEWKFGSQSSQIRKDEERLIYSLTVQIAATCITINEFLSSDED